MKAITICQPYASLICSGEKRVENRDWYTAHRGPLLIHAGKSRTWLRPSHDERTDLTSGLVIRELPFGAILCRVDLVDCLARDLILAGRYDQKHPWLREHKHMNGPWCLILANVERFEKPIPCTGQLKLFEVPDHRLPVQSVPA